MSKYADLHMHTYFSDGTDSPEQVVQKSIDAGLGCIAITDHDSLDGVRLTQQAAEGTELEVLAGVELSTEIDGKDIHMLGYLMDPENSELGKVLKKAQDIRVSRIQGMIDKLKEKGITDISLEEVCSLTKSNAVGRPHLAQVLMRKGHVPNIKSAFDRYLAEGGPAYVAKFKMSPYEGIELIVKSGGVAVMAHPMVTNKDELIPSFVEAGMRGIETYYPNHPDSARDYYINIAKKHNLVTTGGSDAHGDAKMNTYIGKARIPYQFVEELKACVA